MNSHYFSRTLIGIGLLLAGCSGGLPYRDDNHSVVPAAAPDDTPSPVIPDFTQEQIETRRMAFEASPEYAPRGFTPSLVDNSKAVIKAAAAYARGATGAGEVVVIIDSGAAPHRELDAPGKVTFRHIDPDYRGYDDPDSARHGTLVTGLAIARRDLVRTSPPVNMHGVAFDARAVVVPIDTSGGGGDRPYRPISLQTLGGSDRSLAYIFEEALKVRAPFINISWGFRGAIDEMDEDAQGQLSPLYTAAALESALSRTLAVLRQRGVADARKAIFIRAAGNFGCAPGGPRCTPPLDAEGNPVQFGSPGVLAGIAARFPELNLTNITVVALDLATNEIADFSNRCGIARAACITAPGAGLIVPSSSNPNAYRVSNGTSLSTPIVTGALAVMRQFFRRQLGNTQLVARMFATANKSGRYANADLYGQGLLDLDAATRPSGDTSMALSSRLDGARVAFTGSRLSFLGGHTGGTLARALGGRELVVFDTLGAPFFVPLDGLLADARAPRHFAGAGRNHQRQTLSLGDGRLELGYSVPVSSPVEKARGSTPDFAGFNTPHPGDTPHLGATPHPSDRLDSLLLADDKRFLSYGIHPGRVFGLYSNGTRAHDLEAGALYAAPYLAFLRHGLGWGGGHLTRGGERIRYGLFRGAARLSGWDRPAGRANLGGLVEFAAPGEHFSLQAGALDETEGFAGLLPRGVFGVPRHSLTLFGGLNATLPLGNRGRALLAVYAGHTSPGTVNQGIIQGASPVLSSAFSLGVEHSSFFTPGDRFNLSLHQPLRVESGRLYFRAPVARTPEGEVHFKRFGAGLTPAERELELKATYARWLGPLLLRTDLSLRRHPGHERQPEEVRMTLDLSLPL